MLRNRQDIWLAAALFTVFTVSVVWLVTFLIYPKEQWAWELAVGILITASLTYPLTWFMGWLVVRNVELNHELQRIIDRDRLTDVATRDFFFTKMEENPEAYGVSLVVDIDHFKLVNDTHGHLVGDKVIQKVASVLRRACRQFDIICRFGGEEFVIFLLDTPPGRGEAIAERIRRMIEEAEIFEGDHRISVTVSIGGALKDHTLDIEAAIREADAALYAAKATGRNRAIMSWEDEAA